VHILKKSAHSLLGAWLTLLVHIRFTPSEGPKGFVNLFFKKSDHGKRPSSIVQLHGPWFKPTLSVGCHLELHIAITFY
jgi:hypothetical protein